MRSLLMMSHYRGSLFTTLDQAMDAMEHHGWTMVVNNDSYSPFSFCHPLQCNRLRNLEKRYALVLGRKSFKLTTNHRISSYNIHDPHDS
ncbi:unnamed protein product [Strongylus vulgaris]|uniref:Uncharacterized protein n=1 Tax=Strongylus vulgaris TaxID=40348 RepID=A0A3P7IWE1_STRVU|nr:unnamed protein product [Strongylus vulgaris]